MKFSRITFLLLHNFSKWYYNLNYIPRHIVGWVLVICVLSGILGIGYGAIKGTTAAWHYTVSFVKEMLPLWENNHDVEYSSNERKHTEFPIPDNKKHPKRKPQYTKDFGHLNDVHLDAAKKLGITPPETREELDDMTDKLVKLNDTRYYEILELTSSSPYLVPRAADFLTALGRLMQEYNGTSSRFYISSVLRTQADVKKLNRTNVNSSPNSTHCYGTTVDITYSRFDVKGKTTEGQLKEDLARALYDLQEMGYCYVKYEIRQPCFHITVRP